MEDTEIKRTIVLVLAALAVVALVFGLIFYFKSSPKDVAPEVAVTTEVVGEEAGILPEPVPIEKLERQQKLPEDSKEAQLKRFCLDFVARFGTYSTDGESMNLVQLMPLLSGDLKVWAQGRLTPTTAAGAFSGVTTKALSAKILSQSTTDARVVVSTQRTYVDESGSRVVYEEATLSLVGGAPWQVGAVSWKAKAE